MKIIRARFENFKRIEVIEITPDGDVVEITGRNAQGKSSVLDGIEATLGGRRHDPATPIRRGAEEEGARGVLDLGDLIVERRWTATSDRLIVKTPDGAAFGEAQGKLNGLVGGLAFDPLGFLSEKPQAQRQLLLEAIGVDLEPMEERRDEAYRARRVAGRLLKAAEARLAGAPEAAEGTPEEEISLADLSTELREALALKDANDDKRRAAEAKGDKATTATLHHERKMAEIEQLRERLEQATKDGETLAKAKTKATATARRAATAAGKLADPDVEAIQKRMTDADTVNAEVRKAKARADIEFEVKRLGIDHQAQQDAIDAVDQEKRLALTDAEMPVEGLEITDDGLLYEGLPLEQAAQSRKIRVCTAIGAALNPGLRIALVRHGNDLDDEPLAAFYEYCAEVGLQPWVERRDGITPGALVIEAGRIAEGKE